MLGWESIGLRLRQSHTEILLLQLYSPFQMECTSMWTSSNDFQKYQQVNQLLHEHKSSQYQLISATKPARENEFLYAPLPTFGEQGNQSSLIG